MKHLNPKCDKYDCLERGKTPMCFEDWYYLCPKYNAGSLDSEFKRKEPDKIKTMDKNEKSKFYK